MADLNVRLFGVMLELGGFGDERAQLHGESLTRHLEQIQAGLTGSVFQKRTGAPAELQNIHARVHHHAGRGEAAEDHGVRLFADITEQGLHRHACDRVRGRATALEDGIEPGRHAAVACAGELLFVDTLLGIHHAEQVDKSVDGLRRAQHQIAVWPECVMEDGDDFLLQGGVKVDQHVPAGDHVHM